MFYQRVVKRGFDLLIGLIMLLALGWLMAIIALIILFSDGAPVLFVQKRVGQYGKPFRIYKFRSMIKNAETVGPKSTQENDRRITPIGRILRKTSLDELPQIFNIIKGDMSLVGFRPGVYENYTEDDFNSKLFSVKPGITGYSQVNGRSQLTREEKRAGELKYCEDISLIADFRILIKTVCVVLKRSNTN